MKHKKKYISQLERIYDEYKYRENALKLDFTNLYLSLSISMAFYGTLIAFIFKNMNINAFVLYSFLFLGIPVFTYIFGLLYCYNLFAIAKGGYITTTLEKQIIEIQIKLFKKSDFVGWGITEKKKNIGRLLVYGTILMFYILLPLVSIIWGILLSKTKEFNSLLSYFIFLSFTFYIIYVLFIIIIIKEMQSFIKKFHENHEYIL